MTSRRRTIATRRVNQLDAGLLDDELSELLLAPLSTSLGPLLGRHQSTDELWMLGQLLILASSLLLLPNKHNHPPSTYGSRLENLQWLDHPHRISRRKMALYILLSVLPGYLQGRLRDAMISRGYNESARASGYGLGQLLSGRHWRRTVWEGVERLGLIGRLLGLLNFLAFLVQGTFRSPLERLLRIRLVPISSQLRRTVEFEFLNRQLLWQALTDFILFILPLIDFRRLRLRLRALGHRLQALLSGRSTGLHSIMTGRSPEDGAEGEEGDRVRKKRLGGGVGRDRCPICVARRLPTNGAGSLLADPSQPDRQGADGRAHPPEDCALKIAYQVDCCQGLYCYSCLLHDILAWRETHLVSPWSCWRCGDAPTRVSRSDGSSLAPRS
ncbi:peroxisome assembly protein (Peroxin-2) [Puccinia graminis f. sp. tritici]|uniref:Peroxisome assembly protein (Peroxin-2) n=1 Tax=Puccinia graminis f. sp. tritici TaxID=56615 RepID=A0A5B0QGF5_PUCGR|nr:peroxisome assembly protein (Peroxin-2) [Puccinia graminis f. sp. tritici]